MIWVVYILCTLCWIASFVTDTSVLGYSDNTAWWCRITYMFVHRSTIHFAVNMVSLYLCDRSAKRFGAWFGEWMVIPVCVLATFGSEFSCVTVGISGAVYMYLGVILAYYHKQEYIYALLLSLVTNVALFCFQNSNILVHLFAFVYGFTITEIILWIRKNLKKN